jgi:hypothetical protein
MRPAQTGAGRVLVALSTLAVACALATISWLVVSHSPADQPSTNGRVSIVRFSPTEAPSPGDQLIVPSGTTADGFHVLSWTGQPIGVVPSDRSIDGSVPFPAQSPDGSSFIADIQVNHAATRVVLSANGQDLGTLDPHLQYQWGDDSRHICLVQNPIPGTGQQSSLLVSVLAGNPHAIGVLGTGQSTQEVIHSVKVCAVSRDLVVVQDERMITAGPSGFEVETTAIREFRLSPFRLIRTIKLSTTYPVHVVMDSTGQYFAATTLDAAQRTQIIALASGQVLATLQGQEVLEFSGNDACVLVATGSTPQSIVEMRDLQSEHVVAQLTGNVTWVQSRANSGDFAIALASPSSGVAGASAFGTILIIDRAGHVVRVPAAES